MTKFFHSMILFFLLLTFINQNSFSSSTNYIDKKISGGQIRIFLPEKATPKCNALILGVGTAKSAVDYNKISQEIVKENFIVVIMDHNPRNMVKTSASKYKKVAFQIKENLLKWTEKKNCGQIENWIMGGHSASGEAAHKAVAENNDLTDAIFSLDPFNMKNKPDIFIPALYWGFEFTSCYCTKTEAAQSAYLKSKGPRVIHIVPELNVQSSCGTKPQYFHCSFPDNGCFGCSNCGITPDHFYKDIAQSLFKFVKSAFNGKWSKENLILDRALTPHKTYVDGDIHPFK